MAFDMHHALLPASKQYLLHYLKEEMLEEKLQTVALHLLDNRRLFDFSEEDRELQAAIVAILQGDPDMKNDTPLLYEYLLLADKYFPTPDVEQPVHAIEGVEVCLNQPQFEKMARESTLITFGNLQPCMTVLSLTRLFDRFDSRLAQLTDDEREKLWLRGALHCFELEDEKNHPTEEELSFQYRFLKNGFISPEGYVSKILGSRGGDADAVSTGYLHVYTVLKFISGLATETQPQSLLSAQEEMLLKMLSSIQNCAIGRKEGFAAFYNMLPDKDKNLGITEASSPTEKAKRYLANASRQFIGNFFVDLNAMAKEMIAADQDEQYVHSSVYLKNLIANRVGMQWDVSEDDYTYLINGVLYQRDLKEVLEIFYRHATPEALVDHVYARIQRELVPNRAELIAINDELKRLYAELEEKQQQGELEKLMDEMSTLRRNQRKAGQGINARKTRAIEEHMEKIRVEEERLGIADLKAKTAETEQRLEVEGYAQANMEMLNDFIRLLAECEGAHHFFTALDETGTRFEPSRAGVVRLLLFAGLLKEA